MNKLYAVCHKALIICFHCTLFLYFCQPTFEKYLSPLIFPLFVLLLALIVLEASLRFGGRPLRIRSFLINRLSGGLVLAALVVGYLAVNLLSLSYSPIPAEAASIYPVIFNGFILWLGLVSVVDCADRLYTVYITILFSGLASATAILSGYRPQNEAASIAILLAGTITGAAFFLSAQYNNRFKATVVSLISVTAFPAVYLFAGWNRPEDTQAQLNFAEKQAVLSSSFNILKSFNIPELLLGRGAGYDLILSSGGTRNFLLSDLLCGGMLRFVLSVALWLCICYFVGMLFLYRKWIPFIYLFVFGWIFVDSFAISGADFPSHVLFLPFCALLITEHTLLKKDKFQPT